MLRDNDKLVLAKPLDHEEFHTALVRARTLQECERELPSSPRVGGEHHQNRLCSGQLKMFSGTACEEPILDRHSLS